MRSRASFVALTLMVLGGCRPMNESPGPDFTKIIQNAAPSIVGIASGTNVVGTGFKLAGSGALLTAAHVAQAARKNLRVHAQGLDVSGEILRMDTNLDLAILNAAGMESIPGLVLAPADLPLKAGSWIVVLGNPFGAGTTASIGIISSPPGAIPSPAFLRSRIQLNAAVNPGNSGGPVLDLQGRVVGVASAAVPGGFGIGFATPAGAVSSLLEQQTVRE